MNRQRKTENGCVSKNEERFFRQGTITMEMCARVNREEARVGCQKTDVEAA
jgi:hypothetical protein